jgi:DNA-binding transcriptional MerR regulator
MNPSNATDTSSALTDLQKKWPSLDNDVDRAKAIHDLHSAGVSLRTIAKVLQCSLTLLRQLNVAAQASREDLQLARDSRISTRELIRRSKAAANRRVTDQREAMELKRAKDARHGSKLICDWLDEKGLSGTHGESVVNEARRILAEAEQSGTLPKPTLLSQGLCISEIIQHCRRLKPTDPDPKEVWLYPDWLARWALEAFPDIVTRHEALGIALGEQIKYLPGQTKRHS